MRMPQSNSSEPRGWVQPAWPHPMCRRQAKPRVVTPTTTHVSTPTVPGNDNGNGKSDLAKSMGITVPDFTDGKAMSARMDGELFIVIRNGKDKMPPEASGRANDVVVWNLVHYIRNMAKSQPSAPAQ